MIPYYSPNFGFMDLLRTALSGKAERKLTDYFRQLTGKEYVLITSSCRSALYLAYMSLGRQGMVHVSPLTCQVALLPISASGNQIRFHDVKADDLTLDPDSVQQGIEENSLAIQAIHLGGFPCDMPALRRIADRKGLVLIEDCAQGFGSSYLGTKVGTLGDISCFTLTKNVFGLGGGILATNNREYYAKSQACQEAFQLEAKMKLANRIVSALISSGREIPFCELANGQLNKLKQSYMAKTNSSTEGIVLKELRKPSGLYASSVAARLDKIEKLNRIRQHKARQIIKILEPLGFKFQTNINSVSAYTKLFCHHPQIRSEEFIMSLNNSGLEAMHLEHKNGVYYQPKMTLSMPNVTEDILRNYAGIHDRLLSLPLYETISSKALEQIQAIIERKLPCQGNAY